MLFVPGRIRKTKKKDKKLAETTAEILQSVRSLNHNEQTFALLQFMERENAQARVHELEILKLLMPLHGQSTLNNPAWSNIFCIAICFPGLMDEWFMIVKCQ